MQSRPIIFAVLVVANQWGREGVVPATPRLDRIVFADY